MARLVAYGHAGIDPKIMGLGPVSAVKRALAKAGLKIGDLDVIESNEAFAAQALGVSQGTRARCGQGQSERRRGRARPSDRRDRLRSSPIKAMYELQRTGGRYGLITMCIGGGQGIAAIIERM